jgi:hypothetical protein
LDSSKAALSGVSLLVASLAYWKVATRGTFSAAKLAGKLECDEAVSLETMRDSLKAAM